jgi:predicted RNA-binding Zn-ribbon protein involved in translation (DUF1610 family)
MGLVNCVRCGNVFNPERGQAICPNCSMDENRDLKKVTDFLKKNPLASVMEVHEKTGVAQQQIFRMINSGSLKITRKASQFKCRLCGVEISKGTVCRSCEGKIQGGFEKKK